MSRPGVATGAVRALGDWVATLRFEEAPAGVRERLLLTLEDTVGVAMAGARTPELQALREAAPPPTGPARLLGVRGEAAVEQAVWHNGTAACCLELDEGNKFARGHPAAHAFPAALALAAERRPSGAELCAALLAGHEAAARLGRAVQLRPGVHPHGNWGAGGAAAAAARLLALDGERTAAAIDAAGALGLAGPFEAAQRGSFVRNTWIGAAGVHGVQCARLAAAGLAEVDGMTEAGLSLLGDFDPEPIAAELGERYDVMLGYFKRHASCSFTHPPADAALELRADNPTADWNRAREITVETHVLAAHLDRREPRTRLAAMFSIPYVTAVALLHGDCAPIRFEEDERGRAEVRRLAGRVHVVHRPGMDAGLPTERPARVTVSLDGGDEVSAEVTNPVGDADNSPFGRAEVAHKLESLLAPHDIDAGEVRQLLAELPLAGSAADVIALLP